MARPAHCDRPPACPCNEVTNHTVSALADGGQSCSLHGHHNPSTLKEEGLRLVTETSWGHSLERTQGPDQAAPDILPGTNPPRLYLSKRDPQCTLSSTGRGHICMKNCQPCKHPRP